MDTQLSKLKEISLISANFGNGLVFRDILTDWFNFLGGKPGEVVVVDGGSNAETQTVYWDLFQAGMIDKLQVIQPNHEENDKDLCYIQEYTAAAIASKPYLLLFKIDTLPYREGHENWLEEAIDYLENSEVFAIGGSFNLPSKHHEAWPGWYFSDKCSFNFTLIKRSTFMAAVHEFGSSYIISGFKGTNPAQGTEQARFWLEVALEQYIKRHDVYTLCKVEDPTWTVFHTNTNGELLKETRQKYLNRKDINRFMNAGFSDEERFPDRAIYYGQKPIGLIKKVRILFGKSVAGAYWRRLKQSLKPLIGI
ncbi:MAG TPA: hypothetical protein VK211_10250 [Kamptonema sp.]|nr:hypothetical protein [Kamptonema sp.]